MQCVAFNKLYLLDVMYSIFWDIYCHPVHGRYNGYYVSLSHDYVSVFPQEQTIVFVITYLFILEYCLFILNYMLATVCLILTNTSQSQNERQESIRINNCLLKEPSP